MALPIQVNPQNPFIDIHTGRGQGSCTFANGFDCVCSCAGIAHAQLLRMVLTPENSKELPDKYKQALANKVQTVQARIADIPHDKVTTIIHAQKQPKRVFFLCEDVSHPIIDYCRVIDILRWARENPLASQQVSKLCTCVQNHGINCYKEYKIQDEINQHRNAANALWDIRESYISLLTDYDILENDDIRHQRDVLCKKVSEVNNNYPATDSKSYRAAQKALKKDEEQTFKEGEIDSILPNRIG